MTPLQSEPRINAQDPSGVDLTLRLVLEGDEKGAWALPTLPRWFPAGKRAVHLVQAMADVSDAGWVHAEPETFWEAISQRRNALHKRRDDYCQTLEREGFKVLDQAVTDVSDLGATSILQNLGKTPGELLVIAAREDLPRVHPTSAFTVRLATHAPCPVLILKKSVLPKTGPLKVMLCTDGTEASATAARKLPGLLAGLPLEVTLVTVQNQIYLENPVIAPYVNTAAIDQALAENAGMILEMGKTLLSAQGVPVVDTVQLYGTAAFELMVEAEKRAPDLLVVGSHNRPDHPTWLLGSVSSRLLQSDPHPILVVR